ncbi:FAD binding domain-containing protein [Streptomyces sp. CRN 30]|uniref:FAD binding domain-containing protein n=1 Tax=Streptomyces sp. CRN 30 TaxID=3075613 RepID=UPI002A819EA7|nr:FAD binding domain-containing protein [Streptomyces sp. CRN 30]
MLLRLPTSVSEAQEYLAQGAVPIGGATLVWAGWQRDGFPDLAMSLRELPEANGIGRETLGAAVLLHRIDERVPEVLRRAAGTVGTGAVRRTATVGGNIVGSTLRCLLPAALVLDARATVLSKERTYETDLTDLLAERRLLLSLAWSAPVASGYRKLPADAGGPPPLVVATAVHRGEDGRRLLRVAVRDGYEVVDETTGHCANAEDAADAVDAGALGALPAQARTVVREEIKDVLSRADER